MARKFTRRRSGGLEGWKVYPPSLWLVYPPTLWRARRLGGERPVLNNVFEKQLDFLENGVYNNSQNDLIGEST
jgi:hypothetical protein